MREQKIQLWFGLVAIALGGALLHYKMHPPQGHFTNFWASFFSGLDLIVVSLLFVRKSTAVWGLLLNSFLVFVGIIMMSDLTVVSVLSGWMTVRFLENPFQWLIESMLPYISIAVADFMLGLALYKLTITAK